MQAIISNQYFYINEVKVSAAGKTYYSGSFTCKWKDSGTDKDKSRLFANVHPPKEYTGMHDKGESIVVSGRMGIEHYGADRKPQFVVWADEFTTSPRLNQEASRTQASNGKEEIIDDLPF
jgi:hypothetical protein